MSTTDETLTRLDEMRARYKQGGKLPTIEELEAILKAGEEPNIEILPSGVERDETLALVDAYEDLRADREALVLLLRTIRLAEAPSVPGDGGLWLRTAGGATHRIGPESPAWPAWKRARPLLEAQAMTDEKPLRVQVAEAEGWTHGDPPKEVPTRHGWAFDECGPFGSPPSDYRDGRGRRSRLARIPPFGENTPAGQALAVQLQHKHLIGVQPVQAFGSDCGHTGIHYETTADDPLDNTRLIGACGAHIPEAVGWCVVKLAEARKAGRPQLI